MSKKLDRPAPPYRQIADEIRDQIRRGAIEAGDRVPSVRDLVREYDVAMATAHRAIRALQAEGLIRAEPGLGNVVTSEAERGWSASAWVEKAKRTGRIYPAGQHARIVETGFADASEQVAGSLGLEVGERVIRRDRVTYLDSLPMSTSTSWFRGSVADAAPKLLEPGRIPEGTFVYLAVAIGRRVGSWQDQYDPALATPAEAKLLSILEGSALNHGRNWIYDDQGDVLEYGESVSSGRIMYRGDLDS